MYQEAIGKMQELSGHVVESVEKFRQNACKAKWCEIEFHLRHKEEEVVFNRVPYIGGIEICYKDSGTSVLFMDWAPPKIQIYKDGELVKEARVEEDDDRLRGFSARYIIELVNETREFVDQVLLPHMKI